MALIGPSGRPLTSAPVVNNDANASSPYIKDSGLASFAADVLEASRQVPVIVDFWAPWCGPCKQLGPSLEKAVKDAKGAVRLVKINIDENPEIAQQLRIQSIPTVYAFRDGQPVDGFMGALPDSQVETFVSQLAGAADSNGHNHSHGGPEHTAEVLAMADEALAAGDISAAAQAYGHVLQDEPGQLRAVAGLATCYLRSGDLERARTTLQLVRPDGVNNEVIRAVEAELKLRDNAVPRGDLEVLRAKLAADDGDLQARYDLALALDARGDREGAIAEFLELIGRNRKWNEGAARQQLLTIFEAMGPSDPRTITAQRKLSGLLFS